MINAMAKLQGVGKEEERSSKETGKKLERRSKIAAK
jgi:hypothetical protein